MVRKVVNLLESRFVLELENISVNKFGRRSWSPP